MPSVQRLGLVASFVLASALARGEERDYFFYDLGNLGCIEPYWKEAEDITDSGVIGGYSREPGCREIHATLWENGRLTDLNGSFEGVLRSAGEISETKVIVANALPDGETWYHAVVIRDDQFLPLSLPAGCNWHGSAKDINAQGTLVVGECFTDAFFSRAILFSALDGEAMADLGFLPGCLDEDFWAEAEGVNDDGVATGTIWCNDDPARGFIWSDGVMTEIINTVGGGLVVAKAINNQGLVVGGAETPEGNRAMSYDTSTGSMTVLGIGSGEAVNDRGSAVGEVIFDFSIRHSLLYEDGQTRDLAEYFPSDLRDDNWPNAINNYGWIVGWAEEEINNNYHSFLLVPEYDKGDYDGDTDVDHQDFQHFQRCFAAEPYIDGTLHVGCSVFDFDDDVDLDLEDYAAFQSAFTGPTAPNLNPNGPG